MKVYALITCLSIMLFVHPARAVTSAGGAGQGNVQGSGVGKITRRLKIKAKPDAKYTDEGRKNRVEGKVVLRVVFGADGSIGDITPVKELPYGLTDEAVKAARLMSFEPEEVNGRPVPKTLNVVYIFRL
jgi:TonB family protein